MELILFDLFIYSMCTSERFLHDKELTFLSLQYLNYQSIIICIIFVSLCIVNYCFVGNFTSFFDSI